MAGKCLYLKSKLADADMAYFALHQVQPKDNKACQLH